MRTQPAVTILIAALVVLGASSATHATARKTSRPAAKSQAAGNPAAKKLSSSAAKKRTAAKRRTTARQHMPTAPTPARISEIQSALADQGAYQGAPSGKWDAATSDAMQRFQQAHGLSPTGKLDAPSLEKLGLGSDTAGVAAPLPQPQASAGDPRAPLHSQNP